jgi:hypothetical protein
VDGAAVPLDDAPGHRQPEPGSLRSFGGEERLERAAANLVGHPAAGVGHGDDGTVSVLGQHEPARAAVGHGVQRVVEEVGEDLAELLRASGDGARPALDRDLVAHAAALRLVPPARADQLHHLRDHLVEVDRHEGQPAAGAGELQDASHGLGAVLGRLQDGLQRARPGEICFPPQQELGAADDHGQEVVEVVGHPGRHLAQRAEALALHQALLAARQVLVGAPELLVERGVLDRRPGVVGQPLEHGLVAVRERAPGAVGDVEEPFELVTAADGDDHLGHGALGPGQLHVVPGDPGVGQVVDGAEGLAGGQHPSAAALARLDDDPRPQVGAEPGAVPEHERAARLAAQRDAREVGFAEVPRALDHALQDDVEFQRAVHLPGQLGHHLGLAPASLGGRVELGVLQRDAGLGGEDLQQLDLLLREGSRLVAVEGHRPERPVGHQQRHRQHGPVTLGLHPVPGGGGQREGRVVEEVGRPDRPALVDGGGGGAVPPVRRAERREGRAQAASGDETDDGLRPLRLQDSDRAAARPQQQAGLLDDAVEHRGQVQGRGDGPGHLQHDPRLLDPPLEGERRPGLRLGRPFGPAQAEHRPGRGGQLAGSHGLAQEGVAAHLQRRRALVLFHVDAREHHHRNVPGAGVGLQPASDLASVAVRQLGIDDEQVEGPGEPGLGLGRRGGLADGEAGPAEGVRQERPDRGVVVDDEHGRRGLARGRRRLAEVGRRTFDADRTSIAAPGSATSDLSARPGRT